MDAEVGDESDSASLEVSHRERCSPNFTSEQQERVMRESLRFLGDTILLPLEGKVNLCVE